MAWSCDGNGLAGDRVFDLCAWPRAPAAGFLGRLTGKCSGGCAAVSILYTIQIIARVYAGILGCSGEIDEGHGGRDASRRPSVVVACRNRYMPRLFTVDGFDYTFSDEMLVILIQIQIQARPQASREQHIIVARSPVSCLACYRLVVRGCASRPLVRAQGVAGKG